MQYTAHYPEIKAMKKLLLPLIVALAALSITGRMPVAEIGSKLGLQSWTCRNMIFDQIVEFAARHHSEYVQFTGAMLDPAAPREEMLRKKAVLEQKGIVPYTMGVMATSLDKEEKRRLFELARLLGMKFIVDEPKNLAQWDNLEALVGGDDTGLAIHNHGTGTLYGNPAMVKKVLAGRDQRIGVCLDFGRVTAAGFDAAKVLQDYGAERVFDLHFKDKKLDVSGGKSVPIDTELGQGDDNYKGLFAVIKQIGWSIIMAIETDSKVFAQAPNPLVDAATKTFAGQAK